MNKNNGSSTLPASPYIVWSTLFIVIPLIIIVFFSFTQETASGYSFTLENFKRVLNSQYVSVFRRSLVLAFQSTVLCLILGYPVAYFISKMKSNRRNILIMLFIVPMWMNFLLRTYAWLPILGKNGVINNFLSAIGLNTINILYTDAAVLLGMVYNFLPYMILPIFSVLTKLDNSLVEAAQDLGSNKFEVIKNVIIPLSKPGILSGITMVFVPCVSTFYITQKLGGGQVVLIGDVIETQFQSANNYNLGAALSFVLMILIFICLGVMNYFGADENGDGGVII